MTHFTPSPETLALVAEAGCSIETEQDHYSPSGLAVVCHAHDAPYGDTDAPWAASGTLADLDDHLYEHALYRAERQAVTA